MPRQITAILAHPHKDALLRPWWNVIHHWTGRLIVFLSILTVWLGISLIEPHSVAWGYAYGVLLGALVIAALVLEGFLFWKWLMDDSPSTPLQVSCSPWAVESWFRAWEGRMWRCSQCA